MVISLRNCFEPSGFLTSEMRSTMRRALLTGGLPLKMPKPSLRMFVVSTTSVSPSQCAKDWPMALASTSSEPGSAIEADAPDAAIDLEEDGHTIRA